MASIDKFMEVVNAGIMESNFTGEQIMGVIRAAVGLEDSWKSAISKCSTFHELMIMGLAVQAAAANVARRPDSCKENLTCNVCGAEGHLSYWPGACPQITKVRQGLIPLPVNTCRRCLRSTHGGARRNQCPGGLVDCHNIAGSGGTYSTLCPVHKSIHFLVCCDPPIRPPGWPKWTMSKKYVDKDEPNDEGSPLKKQRKNL